MYNEVWFKRPGQASNLTPNAGTAQLCNTSAEVINKRTLVSTGKYNLLSTYNNLNDWFLPNWSSVNI